MKNRPNILYIMTDQQSASAMSCAGNPDIKTPAIDRLAKEGVRFGMTYCTQPLCTPSRGSMFSGFMPHACGVWKNGSSISEDLREQELGNLLKNSGYACVYGGKWHVPRVAMPEDNDHGFRVISGFNDNKLADACTAYFQEYTGRDQENREPFFMVASFDNPHNICEWGRNMRLPWGHLEDPPPPEKCPNLPANFMPPAFEPEILRLEQACNWNLYPYATRTEEDWRQLRWAYFHLVEKVDHEIGRILAGLDEAGLTDNTVIVFSSDHGDAHGAHQLNQKTFLYEEQTRVPLIIRPPEGRRDVVDSEHLVSIGLDLLPTLCDYAGISAPSALTGLSLKPLVNGDGVDEWRESLYVETFGDEDRAYGVHGRMLRTRHHKYIVYDRGKNCEQLFDLQNDPGEMQNLAVEDRRRALLAEHRKLLSEHLERTGDRFKIPSGKPS